ncbi:MAG: conjugal transfer protein TraF [Elusimicrobia bacterium]|nr:conjugal transfer protein TraF [Elusimicrobiota bacterium]
MRKLLIVISCLAAPAVLSAEQWQVLGTRPMGMGGAFVAVAEGPVAQYWNPGGLVKSSANVSGMEIPVGVNAEFTGGIVKNASAIGDMASQFSAINKAQTDGTAINAEDAAAFVKTVSLLSDMNKPGKGALVEAGGGLNFKFSKLALSVNNFTAVGMTPFVDTKNVGLGASTGVSGISMAAVTNANVAAPTDPTQAAAATTIAGAITTIGYTNLETLICGGSGCLSSQTSAKITDPATLANAFVNLAAPSMTSAQIADAANMMSQYAAGAAPVVAGAVSGNSYTANTSNLTLDAASFTEIAAGYAWSANKWLSGLSIGGNLKMVNGRMATTTFQFMNNSNTGDAFKDMLKDAKSSWAPAADIGALWDVNAKYPRLPLHPKVGVVVRNLNSPKFDRPDTVGGTYKLDRQARMGVALKPANFWTLAADMDLTKNSTEVSGYDSRQLAFGTEINVVNRKAFNIPLRAGLMKNVAEKSSKLAYTLGTGLNLLYMHFDVSGVISSEKTKLDDKNIPTKVGVAASFGLLF